MAHKIGFKNSTLGETKLIFLVYPKDSEKIGSIGRQSKNNIIWFLGSVFFEKKIFYIANAEEKR